ncbi:uncharacterized protein MYCGRDRAFT_69592 [Zymoseptoria tritici IPO323]|uniref:RING-type E3 ubiquitin transferase n=1 Tax=Zymoseptoria tritici (strain CBS 115943 / IPO323) TaxID=336722 RepID=F9X674_ZYMTI|nr:uncharacterized protein MYCGRDRAFT_69592 [Zymoseptoria tritici IPO323]EGP88728.1 hypothetical protein MYCGRDRAFT_69592 [Zymoseptoria tritici IPO323]
MDEPLAQPPPLDSPDIMNDPAFAPPQRHDTTSSKHGSESGGETCRICRSEGTNEEPLFHPCKCSGSIKFVHQECLMEWLSHSHKKHCELCKTPFRFTKLYDANMPRSLPWTVFARRACIHAATLCVKTLRALMVGLVWLVFIPYTVRWSWRWMFWVADAGWEREPFLRDMQARDVAAQAQTEFNETGVVSQISRTIHMTWDQIWKAQAGTPLEQPTTDLKDMVSDAISSAPSNGTVNSTTPWSPQNDTSILSSWTYLSQTTSNEQVNRWILDVFEGQLITCVVITGFILIFLIREWVVQQQPLVNLDVVNVEQRERERLARETERLRAQTQLLDEGRARLHMLEERAHEIANDMDNSSAEHREYGILSEFVGWEQLAVEMDRANAHLRRDEEAGRTEFMEAATKVVREVRSAERSRVSVADLSEKMYWKLAFFTAEERFEWEGILVSELKRMDEQESIEPLLHQQESSQKSVEARTDVAESSSSGRPPMPTRDTSFRATQPSGDAPASGAPSTAPAHSAVPALEQDGQASNPFHPEGPEPDQPESESLRDRVASVFREEFGLEEEDIQDLHPTGQGQIGHSAGPAVQPIITAHPATDSPTMLQRVYDWFWGDIHPADAQEPALPPVEERIGEGGDAQEAPFVPNENGALAIDDETQNNANEGQHNDPEVVQAAQAAGLDAEAVEDAEDLEGIFELIGFQGPIMGLFQTSCFCTVLVAGSVFGAVGLPYIWGKLVLSIIASPVLFLVQSPLRLASLVADTIIDLTLVSLGLMTYGAARLVDLIFAPIEIIWPGIDKYDHSPWILSRAKSTAVNAANRIFDLFLISEPVADVDVGWSRAYLSASVHAHASLTSLKDSVNAVVNYTGQTVTAAVDFIATGSLSVAWDSSMKALSHLTELPAKVMAGLDSAVRYIRPVIRAFSSLKTGALTFETTETAMDPSLAYWSTTDRGLAILTGYVALAVIAAIYVALDTPITSTPSGQRTEKVIRDSLRQAGGVLKVIFIISIEMLAFPLYCGLLLDFAFLPLFQADNIATRWASAVRAPATFCFVHWFIGTCYMFHFALFVSMCRKILRKGVLWFIRDPDDPTFHPVRDVLERNVTTQLRKIAFSALVYGALVILCLGGVIWSIGKLFNGIFPIHWISTEPILEFPFDLMLYNFLTPLLFKLFKPSNAVHSMYSWWLRKCARGLRLSHFLFDDRRKDEEGRHVRRSWVTFLALKKGDVENPSASAECQITQEGETPEVFFKRDGKYVLTPCNDQYRPPKPGEAFLHADDEDVYITDKEGKKHEHFAKIYVPPFFRLRVTLFMVCLWGFSAFTGLCATLVPLVFGRQIFNALLPSNVRINDIYAYSLGAYIICGVLFAAHKGRQGTQYLREKAQSLDLQALATVMTRYSTRAVKCAYVYGFLGVVLPLVFALVMQLYIVLPLHTYLVVEHTVHLLADYALGLLYVRIAIRFILMAPTSRAAEAFRRITADGYLNPSPRLATRYFVLPCSLLAAVVLIGPLGIAGLGMQVAGTLGWQGGVRGALQTTIYRYSYPIVAGLGALFWAFGVVGSVVNKWRASVRDEVYLVGERLHNFGEGRPPVGSRSVVRKDR